VAVSVVVAVPALLWGNRRTAELSRQRQDRQPGAEARMLSHVQGITVNRAFNLTGERQQLFREALDEFCATSLRMVSRQVLPVLQLGIPLVIAAVAYWLFGRRLDATAAKVALELSWVCTAQAADVTSATLSNDNHFHYA
jgi:hypothetical protein